MGQNIVIAHLDYSIPGLKPGCSPDPFINRDDKELTLLLLPATLKHGYNVRNYFCFATGLLQHADYCHTKSSRYERRTEQVTHADRLSMVWRRRRRRLVVVPRGRGRGRRARRRRGAHARGAQPAWGSQCSWKRIKHFNKTCFATLTPAI